MIPINRLESIAGERLSSLLLSERGISSEEFDDLVGSTIARMNIVGSLRSDGFEIVGGRGTMYRVLGWEKPTQKTFDWTPERCKVRDRIESLPMLSLNHYRLIHTRLASREQTMIHESSFGYMWGYEAVGNSSLNRAAVFVIDAPFLDGMTLLQRRFANFPRLRVIDVDYTVEAYRSLIPELSILSTYPVEIRNLTESKLRRLKEVFPKAIIGKAHQSIYDTYAIASNPESYFSKKSWKSTQKNLREVTFKFVDLTPEVKRDAKFVIDSWKSYREQAQLRLAIGRDYALIDRQIPGCFYIMGYRGDQPVSLRILSLIPSSSPTPAVADLVEKSFNYSSLPGGHSGMSDTCLVETCRLLSERGLFFINGGESASVSTNLVEYKSKFEASRVWSYTLTPVFEEGSDYDLRFKV